MGSTWTPVFMALACIIAFTIAHPDNPDTATDSSTANLHCLKGAGAVTFPPKSLKQSRSLVNFQSFKFPTKRSPLRQASDAAARFLTKPSFSSSSSPQQPVIHEESLLVDDNKAALLEELKKAYPDHTPVDENVGKLSRIVGAVKQNIRKALNKYVPFCRPSERNDADQPSKKNLKNEKVWAAKPTLELTREFMKERMADLLKEAPDLITEVMEVLEALLESKTKPKRVSSECSMEEIQDSPMKDLEAKLTKVLQGVKRESRAQISTKLIQLVEDYEKSGVLQPNGLYDYDVKSLQEEHGSNVLDLPKSASFLKILWAAINSFFVLLLVAGCVALFSMKKPVDGGVMFAVMLFVIFMGTIPEYNASRQADLMDIEEPGNIQVIRNGGVRKIISESELVPGDIIYLETGQGVPADCRVFQSSDLKVVEASLTGEPKHLAKCDGAVAEMGEDCHTFDNLIMKGTHVSEGHGLAEVFGIGMNTRMGSIQEQLIMKERKSTPIMDKVEALVFAFVKVSVSVIVVLGVLLMALRRTPVPQSTQNRFLQVFMLMISLCIAVIPEGLPISCTLSLNKGRRAIQEECEARIRTMAAVESLSAVDVFCSDKTGTLTTGVMTAVEAYTFGQAIALNRGDLEASQSEKLDPLMTIAWLCNSAQLMDDGTFTGQATDVALARVAHEHRFRSGKDEILKKYTVKNVNTFNADRKTMSVVVEHNPSDTFFTSSLPLVALVKGSPGVILDKCDNILRPDGDVYPLSAEERSQLHQTVDNMSSKGQRVLALAYSCMRNQQDHSVNVENSLTFIGFFAIEDPLRDSVPGTIRRLKRAGIAVKMITGDMLLTAKAIATDAEIFEPLLHKAIKCIDLREKQQVVDDIKSDLKLLGYKMRDGISQEHRDEITAILTPDSTAESLNKKLIEALNDLDDLVEQTSVFAQARPEDKVTIVESLQRRGHIVAMTGDGVNDAPALKKADAGIAVSSATDLTKRIAPINLLSEDFSMVAVLIEQGRLVGENMGKAVYCMFGANPGELGPFFGGLFGLPASLDSLMVLWLNAFTDIFNIVPFANDRAPRDLMLDPPTPVSAPVLKGFHWAQILQINLLTTICALAIQMFSYSQDFGNLKGDTNDVHSELAERAYSVSSTAVMTFMTLSQLFFSYTCRDLTGSVIGPQFFTNRGMHIAVVVSGLLTAAVPYVPKLSGLLKMHVMPANVFTMAVALSLALPLGHEALKALFKIRFVKRCFGMISEQFVSDVENPASRSKLTLTEIDPLSDNAPHRH